MTREDPIKRGWGGSSRRPRQAPHSADGTDGLEMPAPGLRGPASRMVVGKEWNRRWEAPTERIRGAPLPEPDHRAPCSGRPSNQRNRQYWKRKNRSQTRRRIRPVTAHHASSTRGSARRSRAPRGSLTPGGTAMPWVPGNQADGRGTQARSSTRASVGPTLITSDLQGFAALPASQRRKSRSQLSKNRAVTCQRVTSILSVNGPRAGPRSPDA